MSKVYSVAVLVGSLRKDSINRKVALALQAMAPDNLALKIVEIGDLPLYNEDIDVTPPLLITPFARRWAKPMPCCSSRPSTTARCRRR